MRFSLHRRNYFWAFIYRNCAWAKFLDGRTAMMIAIMFNLFVGAFVARTHLILELGHFIFATSWTNIVIFLFLSHLISFTFLCSSVLGLSNLTWCPYFLYCALFLLLSFASVVQLIDIILLGWLNLVLQSSIPYLLKLDLSFLIF